MHTEIKVDLAELTKLFVVCNCGVEIGFDLTKQTFIKNCPNCSNVIDEKDRPTWWAVSFKKLLDDRGKR